MEPRVAAAEADGVFGGPSAGLRVVVSGAEADEAGLVVVEAAGEAEGLEAGVGVLEDTAVGIVVEALGDVTGGGVEDPADAADGESVRMR